MDDIVTQQQRQIRQLQRDVERLKTIENGGGGGGPSGLLAAHVYATNDQAVSNVAWTAVTWSTKWYDTDLMWDIAFPTRLTCRHDGLYLIGGGVIWDGTGGGWRALGLKLSTNIDRINYTLPPGAWQYPQVITSQTYMAVGDYLELIHTASLNTTIGHSAYINAYPFMFATRLGYIPAPGPGPTPPPPPQGNYMGLLSPITYVS